MRFAPRRSRRRSHGSSRLILFGFAAAAAGWLYWLRTLEVPPGGSVTRTAVVQASDPMQESRVGRSRRVDADAALAGAADLGRASAGLLTAVAPEDIAADSPAVDNGMREHPDIAAARRIIDEGQLVEARQQLNAFLVRTDLTPAELAEVRELLTTLADQTLFSTRRFPGDPLIDAHTICSGETLTTIARKYDVPWEIVAHINGIRDPGRIGRGRKLKVLRGPFTARVDKSECRLDVYLQDQYVRSFRVSVGKPETPTPVGLWKVTLKQANPPYYAPPGAEGPRVIPADDPTNPLGEYWIGLKGVEGEAVGQDGFGIHGTIEPDLIGRPVSDGCIRLRNEDAGILFMLLATEKSTVSVTE